MLVWVVLALTLALVNCEIFYDYMTPTTTKVLYGDPDDILMKADEQIILKGQHSSPQHTALKLHSKKKSKHIAHTNRNLLVSRVYGEVLQSMP